MRRGKLKQVAESIDPGIVVVEPWTLRRIIRLDGRIIGFGQLHSPRETYPIGRNRLLALVDSRELGISSPGSMPEWLVVVAEPEDGDGEAAGRAEDLDRRLARPLFHACVHLDLQNRIAHGDVATRIAATRREQLGEVEFAEIHGVLLQDDRLFPEAGDADTYVAFVASYLEMRYFAPQTLPYYFPGLQDWEAVDAIIRQDIDGHAVLERLPFRSETSARSHFAPPDTLRPTASGASITLAAFRRLQMQAELAASEGNQVKAALLHASASAGGPRAYRAETQDAACRELRTLSARLRDALSLSQRETADWAVACEALLARAGDRLTSAPARLLFDLQKACVEHEQPVHRTSLWRWIRTGGKRPGERPLPLLENSLTLRHLRRARRRVAATDLAVAAQQNLRSLLDEALSRVESQTRLRLRRTFQDVFDQHGLVPENVPEQVAREKIIEELIDRILERSYVSMADVRDALSKNDLKLPDVAGLGDFLRGDRLLKVDRACRDALAGVYRRGAVYQRWPQMLSSLAFGTRTGRFLTRFVAVPFGGAYFLLEFLRHLGRFLLADDGRGGVVAASLARPPAAPAGGDWWFRVAVLGVGTWLFLLVHRPAFRQWNLALLATCARRAHRWLVEFPLAALRSRAVQFVLDSYVFQVLKDYVFRPVIVTASVALLAGTAGVPLGPRTWLDVALVSALLLNSVLGRFVVDVSAQYLVRLWRDLRIHVIGSVTHWIMDLFRGFVTALERTINLTDEWLRLRRGSSRVVRTFKMLGGLVWSVIAYVVIFVFTLLIEPQINPIKHFPVVTVSHKLILPTGPAIVRQLSTVLGGTQANTLVWTTIWLVPGVFGFLVWELQENWRLYRANRHPTIRAEAIGSHGETMLRLLRAGFHSGTLPKAFAALRRAVRRGETADGKRFRSRWATINRVELDVRRFVERELLGLLTKTEFLPGASVGVGSVRVATNRVDVALTCSAWPGLTSVVRWEYLAGALAGSVRSTGWVTQLSEDARVTLGVAVSGLFQRTGVATASGPLPLTMAPPFTWAAWVSAWQRRARAALAPAAPEHP